MEPNSASDVRCAQLYSRIFDSHQGCYSKSRKLETSLKIIKDLLQNNDWTELTIDERTSLDHSGAHLTSLAEFGSSPFQDSGIEIHFTQTQCLFPDKRMTA